MGHRQSPILNDNKLKLGVFSPNCCSGMAVTKAPERWVNSRENNIRLAQLGDEAGIEFVLPIARWIGYGGETDFMNAAGFQEGRQFATRNADFLFCISVDLDQSKEEVAAIRDQADAKEFPYFRDEVIPRLEKMGLRNPANRPG